MQFQYSVNPDRAIAGMPVGDRESVPRLFPVLPQISTLTLTNSSEAGTLVISVTDDLSGQVYTLNVTISGAVEATSLAEIQTAWRAHGVLNNLFSVSHNGALLFTAVARHPGRSYTIAATPPGAMSVTPAISQSAGGSGIPFGIMVAKGSADGEIAELGASSDIEDVEGLLFRTDGNHFHLLEGDTASAQDLFQRGRDLSVMHRGHCWVRVEQSVTPASTPYIRRALTSGVGTVGALRSGPAGGVQTSTVTPAVNMAFYAFEFGYLGRHYTVQYMPTDGTTSIADAVAGLFDAFGTISGLTPTDNGTDLSIATAAGTQLDYLRNSAWGLDAEAASVVVSLGTADVDAIDASSICEFVTSASASGLALLRMKR